MSLTIENLHQDLNLLKSRKERALQDLHQVLGAISIMEQMISRLINPELEIAPENQEQAPVPECEAEAA